MPLVRSDGERVNHRRRVEGRRPAIVHRVLQSVGSRGPASFGRAVRMGLVVKIDLWKQARPDFTQDHLRAGGSAVIISVLLMIDDGRSSLTGI